MSRHNDVTALLDIPLYAEAMKKLTIAPEELNDTEKVFLLSCAIMLARRYEADRRHAGLIELAYYIVLKYSLSLSDYEPLYDFCVNFGFFPIADAITEKDLLSFQSIQNALLPARIREEYGRGMIVETLEQRETHDKVLSASENDLSYIAPTSFGKSSIVLDHIRRNWETNKRIAIIVPSKSLLLQTYRAVRIAGFGVRILLHDEMYDGEERFIAVFTQERALRLLNKNVISFDTLYIDEAHRLLDRDSRSVLLARLVRLNKQRNPNSKYVYLSPLIAESQNLSINHQSIFEQRVHFTVKEPMLYEYRTDGRVYQYNRFVNEFYLIGSSSGMFRYILQHSTNKTFCYLYAPRKIEQFSKELGNQLPLIQVSPELNTVITNLCTYVHRDFYVIDYLKKGIVYLHGKLPDNIKEYLEYKFSQIPELRFLIANKVILEGINLPIDSLFILNGKNLHGKELINLIGRVNRLDQVFGREKELGKLLPPIHFVNSDEYNRVGGKLENQIQLLKRSQFADNVRNPLLEKFDAQNTKMTSKDRERCETIIEEEETFFSISSVPERILRQRMIALGMNSIYTLTDELCKFILRKIDRLKGHPRLYDVHVLDRLRYVFIRNNDQAITDEDFLRLKNDAAIMYYKKFLDNRRKSLKENIAEQAAYFRYRIQQGDSIVYIGESYGELTHPNAGNVGYQKEVYIDLSTKSPQQLINIAIVKLKMEEDFVNFKLHMFFQMMLDYGIITLEEYHLTIYGTNNPAKLRLIKMGFTINIINRLEQDGQLENVMFDANGNVSTNDDFETYRQGIDDFYRFELSKFI